MLRYAMLVINVVCLLFGAVNSEVDDRKTLKGAQKKKKKKWLRKTVG